MKNLEIIQERGFQYVETGKGSPVVLLHGLFGALSNWLDTVDFLAPRYTLFIPIIPVYEAGTTAASVEGLAHFVQDFIQFKQLKNFTLIGNSLGGHLALLLAINPPADIYSLVLTGSSGLFEEGMGAGFPKRGDRKYIQERVEYTFYSPQTASKELVNEIYNIVNDNAKAMRILKIARSAQRMNLREDIKKIKLPTCLIWGLNDNITPAYVAHQFRRLIQGAELHFIDQCGHAAMMEQPHMFNSIVAQFFQKINFT
ncbi:MAG: alpha/beta fold hydrolase [Bacteroidia bacterium]|nr:alpha/beta fold hydrolase [Bacteroidia bacterium]